MIENPIKITLQHCTPLSVCSHAIRTCWQSFAKGDNGGEKDLALIDRVGNKFKHESTLEHLVFTFYIQGISRACLQELARHRMASLSVKSTRYTLGELKNEPSFFENDAPDPKRAQKYLVFTGVQAVDDASTRSLEALRRLLVDGIRLDFAKYALPEAYKTELVWTINARSLRNFVSLRSGKTALWEIQNLAHQILNTVPLEYHFLFDVPQNP